MAAVRGGAAIRRRLNVIRKNVRAAVNRAMNDAAEDLVERSTAIAPQLTGELVLSADFVKRDRSDSFVRIVFFDTPYAVVRHEDFYNLGPISSQKAGTSDGPVGRKYLSRPFDNNSRRYINDVGAAITRAIRASVR